MVQAWIGFTLSDMTRLHGNGVSQNGSYDYSKECHVATSAKGTMSRDAEQGTHESQFVFPCALFVHRALNGLSLIIWRVLF